MSLLGFALPDPLASCICGVFSKELWRARTQVTSNTVRGVMQMLSHSHYESMFGSTALVYRRPFVCRFECNVRMCAEESLP